ncbi:DUF397 domain-containing protein [Actinomadura sp. 3N508]|uniref:DUF397 domain-containing protein n=1 Tax=Actinomadura sp. 3N508 TaxID=3375153 RepID=UPI0037A03F9B
MNAPTRWSKSSHSGGNEGECVEVAELDGQIGVRDSRDPTAVHLTLTRECFAALLNRLGHSLM